MSPWLSEYTIELTCPSNLCEYRTVKQYSSLFELANELHTDMECPECGNNILIEENVLHLRKKKQR